MDFIDSRGRKFPSLWQPVATLRLGLLPLLEDWNTPILQAWRLGCLDAWMLAGLDWIGSEWLLDRRQWLDGVDGETSHTLELRGARRIGPGC